MNRPRVPQADVVFTDKIVLPSLVPGLLGRPRSALLAGMMGFDSARAAPHRMPLTRHECAERGMSGRTTVNSAAGTSLRNRDVCQPQSSISWPAWPSLACPSSLSTVPILVRSPGSTARCWIERSTPPPTGLRFARRTASASPSTGWLITRRRRGRPSSGPSRCTSTCSLTTSTQPRRQSSISAQPNIRTSPVRPTGSSWTLQVTPSAFVWNDPEGSPRRSVRTHRHDRMICQVPEAMYAARM